MDVSYLTGMFTQKLKICHRSGLFGEELATHLQVNSGKSPEVLWSQSAGPHGLEGCWILGKGPSESIALCLGSCTSSSCDRCTKKGG